MIYCSLFSHMFVGLFWVASLKKIPQVRPISHVGFSLADKTYAGCMGHTPARGDPDGVYALLDVG